MKTALLDTDTLSYFLKGDEAVAAKTQAYLRIYERLNISTITYYEILGGLEYKSATQQIIKFQNFIEKCSLFNLTLASLEISAQIFGNLKQKGITIGTTDLLIAGIAIEHRFQLITNNEKHFHAIEGLDVDNWMKG